MVLDAAHGLVDFPGATDSVPESPGSLFLGIPPAKPWPRSRLRAQPRFPRAEDGLGTVDHLQLAEDGRDVVGHGLVAQRQMCGDLGVALALGQKMQQFPLSLAESGK